MQYTFVLQQVQILNLKTLQQGWSCCHFLAMFGNSSIKGDMQRYLTKVISSSLLQYKGVCIIDFDKLQRKMLKNFSLMAFLVY